MTESGFVFHPHSVEVVERPEGYREFRCLPATWSYSEDGALSSLLAEFYSQRTWVDPQGIQGDPQFWSGSDAAVRLSRLPTADLAVRELTALATRRSVGLNAPKPWVSWPKIEPLAREWEPEATDVHWTQRVPHERTTTDLWTHYGMGEGPVLPTITSYSMRATDRPPLGIDSRPWRGGPGTWYAWSTLLGWDRWPRRQVAQVASTAPDPGRLLLFVSHRWASPEHPDPDAAQLHCLTVGLTLALAAAVLHGSDDGDGLATSSGVPELIHDFLEAELRSVDLQTPALREWASGVRAVAARVTTEAAFIGETRFVETPGAGAALDRIRERVLVWYDYASMFQAPRTPAEDKEFRQQIAALNEIQERAATLVIAGDDRYLSRAWCFFEMCGGMRQRMVELTPSWGTSIGAAGAASGWASTTDQLIGALNTLGLEAIHGSGLHATYREDLTVIAGLLSRLPLTGLIETDDSDLIGGAVPMPFRAGQWVFPAGAREVQPSHEYETGTVEDFGRIPSGDAMVRAATECAGADSLTGEVGIWVYTTQRALSLAWASRAREMWEVLRARLVAAGEGEQNEAIPPGVEASVACLWADARALAEDGRGWVRTVPSTVRLLVIVTQSGLPAICRIYERVLQAHLASGIPVLTFTPDTGRSRLYLPADAPELNGENRRADVLAVPRIRRAHAYGRQMLLPPDASVVDVEVLAALRLDPAQGFVPPGRLSPEAASAGLGDAGSEITSPGLLGHSERRVRAEALARSTAATWDTWCAPRLHQSAWQVGMAPLQVELVEQLALKALAFSDNPFRRRRLLLTVVEPEVGYALSPSILHATDEIIRLIRQQEAGDAGRPAEGPARNGR